MEIHRFYIVVLLCLIIVVILTVLLYLLFPRHWFVKYIPALGCLLGIAWFIFQARNTSDVGFGAIVYAVLTALCLCGMVAGVMTAVILDLRALFVRRRNRG